MLAAILSHRPRYAAALAAMALLGGCAEETVAPAISIGTRPPPRRPVPPRHLVPPVPQPKVLSRAGLEGVIGAGAEDLARQFGPPRLDVWEGDARKQQFVGTACVLDVYLYPLTPGSVPQATYVEARRATDGRDVDRIACVAALRRR